MSLKIKGAEINSFRAFNEKKDLKFYNDKFNEVSNLVVLYAPNGTGKTSFFDAIEWSMSGKIQRITNNKHVLNIANKEKKYILKNKDSDSDFGTVQLNFSDESALLLTTRKLNNRTKTDYAEGTVVTDNTSLTKSDLNKVIENNLLTHDQIDNFLRFQSSEDRYNALCVFWDRENITEEYQNLVLLSNEMYRTINLQKEEINDLKEELIDLTMNPEIWIEIDRLRKEYREIVTDVRFEFVESDSLRDIYFESVNMKSTNEDKLYKLEEKNIEVIKITKQIEEYYNQRPSQLLECREIIKGHRMFLDIFTNIEKLEEQIKQSIKERKLNQEIIDRYTFVMEFNPKYKQLKQQMKVNQQRLDEAIDQRKKLEISEIDIHVSQKEEENNHKTIIEKVNSLRRKGTLLEELEPYLKIKKENIRLGKELKSIESKKLEYEKDLIIKKQLAEKLLSLLHSNEDEFLEKDIPLNSHFNFIKSQYDQMIKITKEIDIFNQLIINRNNELLFIEKIGSNVEQLKKLGYSVVTETSSKVCPVCEHSFSSFEELIDRIHSTTSDFFESANITNEIRQLEDSKKGSLKDLHEIFKEIQESIKERSDILVSQISDREAQILKLKIEHNLIEKNFSENNLLLANKSMIINELGIEKENIEEILNEEIKINSQEIEEVQKLSENSKTKLLDLEKEVSDISNQLNIIELTIKQIRSSIDDIENNNHLKRYIKEMQYLSETDLSNIHLSLERIKINEMKLRNEEKVLLEQKKERLKLTEGKSKLECIEIIREQERIETSLKEKQKSFEKLSMYTFGEIVDENFDFTKYTDSMETEMKRLDSQNEVLIKLSGIANNFMNENEMENKQSKIIEKENQLKNLSKKYRKISGVKKEYLDSIKSNINNTFNLDTVNKIFQMIEPHPEFREISFKIDEENPDKLGLNIMCRKYNNNEEAPILFLSSAQINILSLSIFLAAAIENTDKLNTILMDDPVQHLDSLNELSFIDLLRILAFDLDMQIILSTHNQQFFDLCKRKIDNRYYSSSFIELSKFI